MESMEKAEAEKDTFKYKASRLLDNISRGNTEPYTQAGAQFLQNLFDRNEEARDNVVRPDDTPQQSSGRQYSGQSQKAERVGNAVPGGPVSDEDYWRRPRR